MVAGVLIGMAAATVLLMLLNAAAFHSFTTDAEQTAIPIEAQP